MLLLAAVGVYLYRRSARLRPRLNWSVFAVAALGALAIVAALAGPSLGVLVGSFQGFGLRAMLLAVVLIVIMIVRPEGLLGRAEFSWAWLFRERLDQPTDEERGQDAWLSNPELTERLEGAGAKIEEGPRREQPEPGANPMTKGKGPQRDAAQKDSGVE